jgi:hypothetical protein
MISKEEPLKINLGSVIFFTIYNKYFQYLHQLARINLAQFVETLLNTPITNLVPMLAIIR